jgi:hypothetical protein
MHDKLAQINWHHLPDENIGLSGLSSAGKVNLSTLPPILCTMHICVTQRIGNSGLSKLLGARGSQIECMHTT